MIFVKTDMVAKGISQDDIPENWVGRWANRSLRMRTMTVSESSPTNSPRRIVQYFFFRFFFVKIVSMPPKNRFFAEKSAEKSDFLFLGYSLYEVVGYL